ncbi:MAG: GNAT family N-acetyltransferase [Candidatus Eremiobacteraeota bacterium]|nr:GNAT family N-acetyltransferase [Candidatus Eremiobacteraeota bacterium]
MGQDILPPDKMVTAIEENIITTYCTLSHMPGATIHSESDMVSVITGVPHPIMNNLLRARFDEPAIDEKIKNALEPFRFRSLPMVWWVGPSSRPSDLGARLVQEGLRHDSDAPGMALDIALLNEEYPVPGGVKIQFIEDRDLLKTCITLFCEAFRLPEFIGLAFYSFFFMLGFKTTTPWRNYIAFQEGKPVGISSMSLCNGIAGIWNVGIIPEARRHGIGTLLTAIPLQEARRLGYRIAILTSTPVGRSVYERMGFREYCSFSLYVLEPPSPPS